MRARVTKEEFPEKAVGAVKIAQFSHEANLRRKKCRKMKKAETVRIIRPPGV